MYVTSSLRHPRQPVTIGCMRRCLVLATVLALASTWSAGAETAATVLSQVITRDEIAAAEGEPARDIKLYELVWRRVSRHYIDVQGLAATPAEIAEAVEYHREFA